MHEAGVVGEAVELQRQFGRTAEPIGIDASPAVRRRVVGLPVMLPEEVQFGCADRIGERNFILPVERAVVIVAVCQRGTRRRP